MVVAHYLTKAQYNYKQATISLFGEHDAQKLTNSVLIVVFKSLGHVCDIRYSKPTILEFLVTLRLAQNGKFWVFRYNSQSIGFWVPHIL